MAAGNRGPPNSEGLGSVALDRVRDILPIRAGYCLFDASIIDS